MDNAMLDERFVLARARAGSSAAFGELIGPYHKSLYRRALKMTKNEEDAEDIVQDAEFKAYRRLDQFHGRSRFCTWMMRIVINESLMKLRKRRFSRELQLLDPAQMEEKYVAAPRFATIEDRPDDSYVTLELENMLKRALAGLSPSLRSTFLLCHIEGYSPREVAFMLNLTVAAIKSRLLRARRRLNSRLKGTLQPPVSASKPDQKSEAVQAA
jgi:RNA polymerase sigma-70 factor (ECF subfamily)